MPWVIPLLSPNAILRGRFPERDAQVVYLKRAVRFLKGDPTPLTRDTTQAPPQTILRPTRADLERFDTEITLWPALSIDIENAGKFITLVGITLYSEERIGPTLSLPFRTRFGLDYWTTWPDHLRACEFLYRWLTDPRTIKCFFNGISHDIPILEETGFVVNGPIEDPMVQVHWCYPEQKKSLQYNATLFCGFPLWKDLVSEEDDFEGKS